MVIRWTSVRRSFSLGISFPVPRLFVCAVLAQPLFGMIYPHPIHSCGGSFSSAHNYRRPRFRDVASTIVRHATPPPHRSAEYVLRDPIRMTVPPNALASISIRGTVWLSSRWNFRAPFIIVAALVAIIGGFAWFL
ncbi:hypothetical protein EDD17DRAFT_1150479 [Pisolithus thermaeus]|nr:hypothetical protein EDD17DRAFT_1150479 [Pisolithus thermaeus]